MSKSIEDYPLSQKCLDYSCSKPGRKYAELSHTHSAFTSRISHYTKATDRLAKSIIVLLNFAHRCELIGITPEMIFRIADKKVNANSFSEVLRRVKLHLSEVEVNQLLALVSRGSASLEYEEYLQCLSTYQVNSEKQRRRIIFMKFEDFYQVYKNLFIGLKLSEAY